MTTPTPPLTPLSIPDFRAFWLARCAATLAQTGMVVAIGYQFYDIARSGDRLSITAASFRLGMLGLAQFVPLFLLTPVAGLIADRIERRRVVAAALALDLGIALALALLTHAGGVTLPLLYGLAAAHGVARVFLGPAMSSIGPNIVPAEILPRAIAFSSIAMQVGTIGGPAAAGLLFAAGAALPYWAASVLMAVAIGCIMLIRPVHVPAANRRADPLRQLREGFAYVVTQRFLLGCMTLDLFAVLLGGATALLPVYARDILQVGPQGLGQMRAAPAVGAVVVGLALSARPLARDVGAKMLWAVAIYGAATVVFGLSHIYVLSLAMLALLGAADMVSVFIRSSLIQLHTPDDRRGRISAISGLAISASNELGEMESGVAAALLGPVGAVVLGGIAAVAITGAWAVLFPEIRRARTFARPEAVTAAEEAVLKEESAL